MDWVTWINTAVGIIGIIVGIIGAQNLHVANQMNNNAKAGKGSTINQGNTYNYGGVSEETVRLITKDMTKEEMCQLIVRLIPINTDNENCIATRLRNGTVTADDFDKIIDEIPTVYYGKTPPPNYPELKAGSLWWDIE